MRARSAALVTSMSNRFLYIWATALRASTSFASASRYGSATVNGVNTASPGFWAAAGHATAKPTAAANRSRRMARPPEIGTADLFSFHAGKSRAPGAAQATHKRMDELDELDELDE